MPTAMTRDKDGKPKACRVRNPVSGCWMYFGCTEAARWLVGSGKIAKISTSTVRAIADGRAKLLNYNPETVSLVQREFPALCGIETTSKKGDTK